MSTSSKMLLLAIVVIVSGGLDGAFLASTGGERSTVGASDARSLQASTPTPTRESLVPPLQTATRSRTATPTPTPMPTPTGTATRSRTATPTRTPTVTASPPPGGLSGGSDPLNADSPSSTPTATPIRVRNVSDSPVDIIEASVPADWVLAGHAVTVRLRVSNPSQRSMRRFRVTLDGAFVSTRVVAVPSATTTEIEFAISFEEATTGRLAVDGVPAGELTVATPTAVGQPANSGSLDRNWFALLVASLGVVTGGLWASRSVRQRDG